MTRYCIYDRERTCTAGCKAYTDEGTCSIVANAAAVREAIDSLADELAWIKVSLGGATGHCEGGGNNHARN